METIKTYEAKFGQVIIQRYDTGEYHVIHTNPALCAFEWFRDKYEALCYAQFLAGKY